MSHNFRIISLHWNSNELIHGFLYFWLFPILISIDLWLIFYFTAAISVSVFNEMNLKFKMVFTHQNEMRTVIILLLILRIDGSIMFDARFLVSWCFNYISCRCFNINFIRSHTGNKRKFHFDVFAQHDVRLK